jgi:diguanylate cyclase (GGDEF)-like protein
MRIRIHHLHTRIALVFVALLLAMQIVAFSVISTAIFSNARHTVNSQLSVSEKVFHQLLSSDDEKLRQAASVTAADFGFRAAVATRDQATVESALKNQGDRIHANLVMLVGPDDKLLADTLAPNEAGSEFSFPDLIASARRDGSASMVGIVNGGLYQLVAVPVRAPLPIAWVVMGFAVDNTLAMRLSDITSLGISFLTKTANGKWTLLASSLPTAGGWQVAHALDAAGAASGATEINLSDERYGARVISLSRNGQRVVAVLQRSLDEAMAPFRRLQSMLLMISVVGFAVSLVGSVLTARSITRPLAALTRFARSLGHGDFEAPIAVAGDDEIGELTQAFNTMRSDLVERERRILDLAYHDTLTRLPNRVMFSERLTQMIERATREGGIFSLLVMDLDRFKLVNDTLGHHMGDSLLFEVGRRLSSILTREMDIVARLGGDEFALLLPDTDLDEAKRFARRIGAALDEPLLIDGHTIDVHSSVGIVAFPLHGTDFHTLMRRADVAMYAAKRVNLGASVYSAADDMHSPERLTLMTELRRAVEHDQLSLYYQPKVDLTNYQVKYAEALVRWIHPERGFIAPDQFIPFAEQTGYIRVLTRWVVDRATRQLAEWHAQGLDISVSINVSARDLLHASLPEVFETSMRKYGVSPEWIWIEITESAVMDDANTALQTLDQLHQMGLRLSIDDFGTGYSSLAYLKRLPVDELKIDKSFVLGMMTDSDDEVIVRSTIDLGHNMGLKVVAEGVETEAAMLHLGWLSCDLVQGYHLSRPLPADKFSDWLTQWHASVAANTHIGMAEGGQQIA